MYFKLITKNHVVFLKNREYNANELQTLSAKPIFFNVIFPFIFLKNFENYSINQIQYVVCSYFNK